MKQGIFTVKENTQLTPTTWRMVLSGDVSAVTASGQFINIKLDGHFLRRPISVNDVFHSAEGVRRSGTSVFAGAETAGTVTIIYKVLGHGTEEMTQLQPGSELDVLTGLGNGYDLSCAGDRPLLIGGGVGIPPLYLAAKMLMRQGVKPTVILGFNSAEEIYYADEFEKLGCRVELATADGSAGIPGFVTDAFREISTECGSPFTHFYTCGPEPMLRAVYETVYKEAGISGQMSFEERMGCGFGACMGCSCRTLTGYKRICKDGPVMRTEEILWG